jgi:hypothetical protein
LFLHAVVGFGLFIYFTAELVGSAAKPPTAFSTIQGTFPIRRAFAHYPEAEMGLIVSTATSSTKSVF